MRAKDSRSHSLRRRFGPPVLLALTGALAGCPAAHVPGPYDPHFALVDDGKPLPSGQAALLAESDAMVAEGPETRDLVRSLRCANAVLASDATHEGAAWRAARALYFLSALEEDKDREKTLSAQCMDVAQIAMASGTSAKAHYWGALCMGARAQAKSLEAIDLLPQMVEVARRALALDPKVERGGPNRVLGGIFLRAPSWPTSVGDLDEALNHLEAAVHLDATWPENHMLFAEALAEDERFEEARVALARAEVQLEAPEMARWAKLWAKDLKRVRAAVAEGD